MTLRKLYTVGLTLSYLLTSTHTIGQSKLDILVEVNNQIKTLQDNQDHPGRLTTDLNTIVDWHNNQIQPQRAVIKGLEEDIIRQEQLIDSLLAVQTEASNLSTIWQDSLDHAIIVLAELRDQLTQQKQSAGGSGNRTDSCYCIRFPWSEVEREMQRTIAHRTYMDTLELCGLNFTDAVHNYESNILQNPLLDERWDLLDLELSHQDTVSQQACIQRNEDHLESIRRQEQINREAREAHEAQLKEARKLDAFNEKFLEILAQYKTKWNNYWKNYWKEFFEEECQLTVEVVIKKDNNEYKPVQLLVYADKFGDYQDEGWSKRVAAIEQYMKRKFGSNYSEKYSLGEVHHYYNDEVVSFHSQHPYLYVSSEKTRRRSHWDWFEFGFDDGASAYDDRIPFESIPVKWHVPVVWLKRCD